MNDRTKERRFEASLCKRHLWVVWWTRRLKKIGGPNHGKRLPYEHLTCRNCQATQSRWKR